MEKNIGNAENHLHEIRKAECLLARRIYDKIMSLRSNNLVPTLITIEEEFIRQSDIFKEDSMLFRLKGVRAKSSKIAEFGEAYYLGNSEFLFVEGPQFDESVQFRNLKYGYERVHDRILKYAPAKKNVHKKDTPRFIHNFNHKRRENK